MISFVYCGEKTGKKKIHRQVMSRGNWDDPSSVWITKTNSPIKRLNEVQKAMFLIAIQCCFLL